MRVRHFATILGLWLLCLPWVAPQAQQPLKIGVVNASRLLDEAPQAKQALKRLEEEFKPRDQQLQKSRERARKLEQRLADPTSKMSDSERRKLEYELRRRQLDIKRNEEALSEDYNFRRNDELRKLQQLIYQAIVALAKKEHFDLILNQDAVVYAGNRVDITDQVLQHLKQEQ